MNNSISKYYGPIAVLDILGFKKYVEDNSLDFVINSYANEIIGASFTSEVLQEDLQMMVYSDTISIRLVNQTEKGFINFIKALQIISSTYFFKCQIPDEKPLPIRGAIAIGDYSWHNGDISKQAINNAHEHEKIQQWIGISMNEETAQKLQVSFPIAFNELVNQNYLIDIKIPLKSNEIRGFVINPTIRAVFKDTFDLFILKCDSIFKDPEVTYETQIKYYNTINLLNHIHINDILLPCFHNNKTLDRKDFEIEIDKSAYQSLIDCFNKNIYKSSENKLGTLNLIVIILSIYVLGALFVDTVYDLDSETSSLLNYFDNVICIFFFVEFCIRFFKADNKLRFMRWGWIDLVSSIPMVDFLRAGRLLRLIRLLRVVRAFRSTSRLLHHIFKNKAQGTLTSVSIISVLIIIFSALAILQVEDDANSNIKTAEDAIWWAYVTITTVGYGDKFPVTTEGRIIASILMTTGVGLFGTFTAFISSLFISNDKKKNDTYDVTE